MSRILNCECGYYISFGHSMKYGYYGDKSDPFYSHNPQCPKCETYFRGDMEPKITLQELHGMMKDDINVMMVKG